MKIKTLTPIIIALMVGFNLTAATLVIAKDYKIMQEQKNLQIP